MEIDARRPQPRLNRGLDYTARMRSLCQDVVSRLGEFQHVDLSRVAICFRQTRTRSRFGVQATLTPMRFEGGAEQTVKRGRTWTVQRMRDERGVEMLYILSFYLPRFHDLPLREKFVTVVHELWHIGPRFDGDLRRHPGRCYAHSSSQKEYDREMGVLVDRWLAQRPDPALYDFLQHDFRQLVALYGGVHGLRVKTPKLIPVAAREG